MLRDILVHIESTSDNSVAEFAARLAEKHGARLTGLSLLPPTPSYYEVSGMVSAPAFDEQALAAEARAIFDNAIRNVDIRTEWRESNGPAIRDLTLHARFADVTILAHRDTNSWFQGLANQFLLNSGHAAILVPNGWTGSETASRATVGWNSTLESARALHHALPLLEKAEFVKVVTVAETAMANDASDAGLDITSHLGAHGIDAELCYAEICDDAGQSLLDRAAEDNCDLLVMGVYGRSRLSEFIYGGASRTVLNETSIPVLMAH